MAKKNRNDESVVAATGHSKNSGNPATPNLHSEKTLLTKAAEFFVSGDNYYVLLAALGSFIYFYHMQFATEWIIDNDSHFHIMFAYLSRIMGTFHSFPWAQLSMWNTQYFDKEFGFHFLLRLFTFGDLTLGAKWAAVCFATFAMTTFYWVLHANKIRWPFLWLILIFNSGGYLLYRVNVTRAQVFSIALSMWSFHFILGRKHWRLFIISTIYALSYTACFLPVVYVIFLMAVQYYRSEKLDKKLLLMAVTGVLFGWLIHPNFPNNFKSLWVQNFSVLQTIWEWGGLTWDMKLGHELKTMTAQSFLLVNTTLLIVFNLALFLNFNNKKAISTNTVFLFVSSLAWWVMIMMTKRFGEYWVPTTYFFVAYFFNDYLKDVNFVDVLQRYKKQSTVLLAIAAVALAVLAKRSYWDVYPQFKNVQRSFYADDSTWMRNNIPHFTERNGKTQRTVIWTCDWDDASEMFFYDYDHYYTCFLDPHFMFHWDQKLWEVWDALTYGIIDNTYETLVNVFDVEYGYCTNDKEPFLTKISQNPKIKILRRSFWGTAFKVER